jgi:hypothetical protein
MRTVIAQLRNPVLPPGLGGGTNPDPNSGGKAIGQLVSNLVGALFIAAFLLTFITLIMGGISWITAGGDKQKLENARNQITHAIVGLIIVAAAFAISSLVARFFGLDLTNLTIPGFK